MDEQLQALANISNFIDTNMDLLSMPSSRVGIMPTVFA